MKRFFTQLYLTRRFALGMGACILLYLFSFSSEWLELPALALLGLFGLITLYDTVLLFRPSTSLAAKRKTEKLLSLGDENPVTLHVHNHSPLRLSLTLLDELPYQFQRRNHVFSFTLEPHAHRELQYELRPLTRGVYGFGKLRLFVRTRLALAERRLSFDTDMQAAVYPSIIQMKRYELKAFANRSDESGLKKIRRIGHTYEFEHIRHYARGDDYRSINWKATGKRNLLMVNQYEDEKSQQVYCIIDKSRSMHMPFDGLSLVDYAINTSLVISNIVLGKQDKAGLITFSDKIGSTLQADRNKGHLKSILENLYKEEVRSGEANYELLYLACKKLIRGRSLIFLFSNFENTYALERALPLMRSIGRTHLLVPVFFENTGVTAIRESAAANMEELYIQTAAENYTLEKFQMLQVMNQAGLSPILTRPADLTINSVNKYLELKAKGWI